MYGSSKLKWLEHCGANSMAMNSNRIEVSKFSSLGGGLQLLKFQFSLQRSYLHLKEYSLLLITMTDNSILSLEIIRGEFDLSNGCMI